jgi:transposase InsO family protein
LLPIKTQIKFASADAMQMALEDFQKLYNTARPHQSLNGITPAMAWLAPRRQPS